jgi:hypothetical protein
MVTKKQAILLTVLLLGAVMALTACGAQTGPGGIAGTPGVATARPDRPDHVRIASDEPIAPPPGATFTTPGGTPPAVTLTDVALVRQLYATIYALPTLPPERACTAERGPHYTLTFLQGTATLATVQANRDGCWPVTIAGETLVREATSAFWQQRDQAIITATPPLSPDRFAIATAPQAGQAPQSALITSATIAQQVYDAILALPRTGASPNCSAEPVPTYQIVFFAGDQAVPASVDDICQTVEVDGGYQWRGGRFATNDQFRSILQSVLAGATFAPAQPDHLKLAVTKGNNPSYQMNGSDHQLMLALYDQVFQLSETAVQPNCPPVEDKVGGKGTFTTLAFTQWDLPLARIDTYQGSCSYVQMSDTGPRLQANQTFWDLINREQAP